MVTLLLKVEILTINGEDLRKIPTEHEESVKVHLTEANMKKIYGENCWVY